MLLNCLFVGCGGFVGSVMRYLLGLLRLEGVPFPVITFGINAIGSFAIMFLTGILAKDAPIGSSFMLFLRVGLCGGFTTFSTFSAETLGLLKSGDVMLAVAYAVLSVLVCVVAAWAGETSSAALAH